MKYSIILSITFTVIALIGLLRFIADARSVNAGAFICPALLAIVFGITYIKRARKK